VINTGLLTALLVMASSADLGAMMPPAPISPPIPDTVLRIQRVADKCALIENTGQRIVTAWAVQVIAIASPHYTDIVSVDRSLGSPLLPGSVDSSATFVSDDIASEQDLRIVAVFFDDGTHMGHAVNRAYGGDVVNQILEQRKGRAEAWAYWQSVFAKLPADDDKAAVQQFVDKASSAPKVSTTIGERHIAVPKTFEQSAADFVHAGMRQRAEEIKSALAGGRHDEKWVRENILRPLSDQIDTARTMTQTSATDKGEAK
jgi:hypothetical protein